MDPSIDADAQLAEVRALIDLARGAEPAAS